MTIQSFPFSSSRLSLFKKEKKKKKKISFGPTVITVSIRDSDRNVQKLPEHPFAYLEM